MLMTQTAVSALDDPNQQLYHNTVTSRHGRFSATATSAGSFQPSTIDRRLPSSSGQAYSAQNSTDPASLDATSIAGRDSSSHDPFYSNITQPPLMNAIAGSAPVGAMYVRALYDYEADDRTSLSFHEGDIIQVITQLESGWWDGVINGVRGWFPSNYCQIIVSPDEIPEPLHNAEAEHADDEPEDGDVYEEGFEEDEGSDHDDFQALPLQETEGDKSRADYWIPQATSDGRLFYYNTMTGESSMELPLESPSSVTETGPRDRMNAHMPDKTRPPPELMARGLMTDEEDSDVNSASEIDGENIMMKSRSSVVSLPTHSCRSPLKWISTDMAVYSGSNATIVRSAGALSVRFHGFDQRPIPGHQEWTNRHLLDGSDPREWSNFLHSNTIQPSHCCHDSAVLF